MSNTTGLIFEEHDLRKAMAFAMKFQGVSEAL